MSIDLSRVSLNSVNLTGVNFIGANLSRASFWGAYLLGAYFDNANLKDATLNNATLKSARLINANLSRAYLLDATLTESILIKAILKRAQLVNTDLREANFRGANLREANFQESNLSGANLSEAIMGWTNFANIDLRAVKGLETIYHIGPSHISTSTLERSQGDIPEAFLRGTGMGDTFIEYVCSLVVRPIDHYSCFLSYSHKDQDVAERLYADLQSKGVRCWYAPHELKPGDYYRHKIDESIRVYDKLVLILSSHSIKSEWVEQEVKTALEREESMDMTHQALFPIRLDDAAMTTSRKWVSTLRYLRHIGDFTGWKDHDAYQTAFQRLLNDLQAESVKKSE